MSYAPRSPAGGHRTACSGSVTVMSSSAADQLRADLREADRCDEGVVCAAV